MMRKARARSRLRHRRRQRAPAALADRRRRIGERPGEGAHERGLDGRAPDRGPTRRRGGAAQVGQGAGTRGSAPGSAGNGSAGGSRRRTASRSGGRADRQGVRPAGGGLRRGETVQDMPVTGAEFALQPLARRGEPYRTAGALEQQAADPPLLLLDTQRSVDGAPRPVRRERPDHEDVDGDHDERPDRRVRQVQELGDQAQGGEDDADRPGPLKAPEDARAGGDGQDAQDEEDPAPAVEVYLLHVGADAPVHVFGSDRLDHL